MDQAEFTLSRPVCLSLPIEEADKLLQEKDGRCALVYLALLRAGGKPFPAERIGLTERELRQTMERLCALGLVSAAGKEQPAPAQRRTAPADDRPGAAEPKLVPAAELPQYTAEDISARMLSDGPMQTVRREAEQLYGRKLTTPEMNMLLGLRDYLGLPADVLMELIHYVFQEYRAERGHAGTPTMRRIEKEAYAWADQEIHTTAQAEEFLQRRHLRPCAEPHRARLHHELAGHGLWLRGDRRGVRPHSRGDRRAQVALSQPHPHELARKRAAHARRDQQR